MACCLPPGAMAPCCWWLRWGEVVRARGRFNAHRKDMTRVFRKSTKQRQRWQKRLNMICYRASGLSASRTGPSLPPIPHPLHFRPRSRLSWARHSIAPRYGAARARAAPPDRLSVVELSPSAVVPPFPWLPFGLPAATARTTNCERDTFPA